MHWVHYEIWLCYNLKFSFERSCIRKSDISYYPCFLSRCLAGYRDTMRAEIASPNWHSYCRWNYLTRYRRASKAIPFTKFWDETTTTTFVKHSFMDNFASTETQLTASSIMGRNSNGDIPSSQPMMQASSFGTNAWKKKTGKRSGHPNEKNDDIADFQDIFEEVDPISGNDWSLLRTQLNTYADKKFRTWRESLSFQFKNDQLKNTKTMNGDPPFPPRVHRANNLVREILTRVFAVAEGDDIKNAASDDDENEIGGV